MTDRELLEAAARAAGLTIHARNQAGRDACGAGDVGLWISNSTPCWNPLADSGDALNLAVKLGLDVSHNSFGKVIVDHYTRPESQKVVLSHGTDPCAATRRAIVRAAAAMATATTA